MDVGATHKRTPATVVAAERRDSNDTLLISKSGNAGSTRVTLARVAIGGSDANVEVGDLVDGEFDLSLGAEARLLFAVVVVVAKANGSNRNPDVRFVQGVEVDWYWFDSGRWF